MGKVIFTVLLGLFFIQNIHGQTNIFGTIKDVDGSPISYGTIQLLPLKLVTTSDANGYFDFTQIPKGSYQLKISYVGFMDRLLDLKLDDSSVDLGKITLIESRNDLDQVVVTASRMLQTIADVPIPISVIDQSQIERSSTVRLSEILSEQTGLTIQSDHGSGIQIQGLDSDYILFLIDGEPIIGRTAGTLDLSRLTVNNIERIEIVKGPSSSLYGSEAMGGVVNIITKTPQPGFGVNVSGRYRTFNTSDLNAAVDYADSKLSISGFYNRLSSDGYDLNEGTIGQTISAYTASTAQSKLKYQIHPDLNLSVSGRYYDEPQKDQTMITLGSNEVLHDYKARRTDWNILPKLEWRIGDKTQITLRQYISNYQTETKIERNDDGSLYSIDIFEQDFSRSEGQGDIFLNEKNTITFGTGFIWEGVNSTRYVDSTFNSAYAFAQHIWQPTELVDITTGLRYDRHNAYGDNFSPKLAVGYQLNKKLKLRASFGGGFKAPDFRQLLLDFTNPTVGYSVMGTTVAIGGIERLIAQGETFGYDPVNNPNSIESARANAVVASQDLKAESSIAFNLGTDYQVNEQVFIQANIFRNQISNLINTWTIAQKDNGQFVYSYQNIEDIVTQGIELQASWSIAPNIKLSGGYQFLDTYDQQALEAIKEGNVAYRAPGEIVSKQVTPSIYGGLFNRSKHSGNIKINYIYQPLDG